MKNYIISEYFRIRKKKSGYIITGILAILTIALAIVLEYYSNTEPGFPYGNIKYYYSNVFAMSNLILAIICFLSVYLLGKDRLIIPTSISLGIKRKSIFIGKFIVTLIHFFVILLILGLVTYLSGQFILTDKSDTVTINFLISLFNLLPILLSALATCYSIALILDNEIIAVIIVFIFYRGLALLIYGLTSVNEKISAIQDYIPASAMNNILSDFMNGTVQINAANWLINLVLALLILIVGLKIVEKKDYS